MSALTADPVAEELAGLVLRLLQSIGVDEPVWSVSAWRREPGLPPGTLVSVKAEKATNRALDAAVAALEAAGATITAVYIWDAAGGREISRLEQAGRPVGLIQAVFRD